MTLLLSKTCYISVYGITRNLMSFVGYHLVLHNVAKKKPVTTCRIKILPLSENIRNCCRIRLRIVILFRISGSCRQFAMDALGAGPVFLVKFGGPLCLTVNVFQLIWWWWTDVSSIMNTDLQNIPVIYLMWRCLGLLHLLNIYILILNHV